MRWQVEICYMIRLSWWPHGEGNFMQNLDVRKLFNCSKQKERLMQRSWGESVVVYARNSKEASVLEASESQRSNRGTSRWVR